MDKEIQDRIDWAIQTCSERGLRKTNALRELLKVLITFQEPLTLADLCESDGLSNQCDRATVFRLLGRLLDKGIIRKLGFQERAAYYIFSYPGEHNDYLVCTDCGKIETLSLKYCPVEALEKEVMKNSGFSGIYHELEFFGQCPACA
jgi:Fur family ferric uptake transcriptional regulator|tara:strand:+ start:42 stop:482 length:441 start_codon:yes stop_codon:yes gene_type:complete